MQAQALHGVCRQDHALLPVQQAGKHHAAGAGLGEGEQFGAVRVGTELLQRALGEAEMDAAHDVGVLVRRFEERCVELYSAEKIRGFLHVAIGEEAVFEVSQGRQPCWKLNDRFEQPDMAARVQADGRTGWYLRVLEPGTIGAGRCGLMTSTASSTQTISSRRLMPRALIAGATTRQRRSAP